MARPDPAGDRQSIWALLARRRWRLTAQRRAIVDAVFSTHEHFTADQLLAWARQRDASVSRATVYRTLQSLTATGLLREIELGADRKWYDPNFAGNPNHSHLVCQDCGRVIEFENPEMLELGRGICEQLGFATVGWRLQVVGACKAFHEQGTCPHRGRPD